jgi:hypothetical protein
MIIRIGFPLTKKLLSFKIAVNSLPRQLRMVIGRKFLGSKGLPLFLYIGLILPISQISLNHEPLDNVNFEQLNEGINTYISQEEILSCIKILKNNKASGEDRIINEYIKSTSGLFGNFYYSYQVYFYNAFQPPLLFV